MKHKIKFLLMLVVLMLCAVGRVWAYENWTSTNHADGSSSEHSWQITGTAGQWLMYDWSVSSEGCCDKLRVFIDGNQVLDRGGELTNTAYYIFDSNKTITMRATYSKDGSVSSGNDQCRVYNIRIMNEAPTVTVTLSDRTVGIGSSQNITYGITPEGITIPLSWSSSNENVVTVNSNGRVTGVSVGTATITATAADGSGVSGSCTVTVAAVESISLSDRNIGIGISGKISKTTLPSGANTACTWVSSNESVATVDSNGQVTGVSAGSATITATATDGSGVSGSCTVTVVLVESITLKDTYTGVEDEDARSISISVLPQVANTTCTWVSSNESVATVDSNGRVTSVSAGTATITATAIDGSGVSASCLVRVFPGKSWSYDNTYQFDSDGRHLNYAYTTGNDSWNYKYVNSYGNAYYQVSESYLDNSLSSGYVTQTEGSQLVINFTADNYTRFQTQGCTGGSSTPNFTITLDDKIVYNALNEGTYNYSYEFEDGTYIWYYSISEILTPGEHELIYSYNNGSSYADKSFALLDYTGLTSFIDTTWEATMANHKVKMDTIVLTREGILGGEALRLHDNLSEFTGLCVSGPFDAYDWRTIREMTNLVCLDLSGVTAKDYERIENYSLKAVRLSEHIPTINENSFPSASYIYVPKEVTSIKKFRGGYDNYPIFADGFEGVDNLSDGAFAGSPIIGSVSFPLLTEVPDNAFKEAKYITEVALANAKKIGRNAFYGSGVASIDYPKVDSIGDYAFCQSAVTDINLPEARYIGNGAFSKRYYYQGDWYHSSFDETNTVNIKSISAPKVEVVGDSAFYRQDSIPSFDSHVLKKVGNYAFCSIDGYRDANGYWHYSSPSDLQTIDLSNVTEIGDYAFYYCNNLQNVDLQRVEKLGNYAFYNCGHITEANISNVIVVGDYAFCSCDNLETVDARRVETIKSSAFSSCYKLRNINIAKVKTIENYAFSSCRSLQEIKLPDVTTLGSNAFYGCSGAKNLELSDKLTAIGNESFFGCTGLETVTLPASLTHLPARCFNGSNNIKKISINAPLPPSVGETPFTMQTVYTSTLFVPENSIALYQTHDYWKHFYYYDVNPSVLKDLVLSSHTTLGDVRMDKLNLTITPGASLTMGGTAPQEFMSVVVKSTGSSTGMMVSDCGRITSDATSLDLEMSGLRWYFISLPFDVDLKDVHNSESAQLAIHYYNGTQRASNGTGASWTRLYSGTLTAGTGYIIQASKATTLTFPASFETKDNIFQPYDVTRTLEANISSNAANQGWNFVGNPYTAYFDIAQLDFNAPITVWSGSTYTAYSIEDDEYALKPLQPFFVQCPEGVSSLTFKAAGRQTTSTITRAQAIEASRQAQQMQLGERHVIDLVIADEKASDRTRIVVNAAASDDYDATSDASKMMSMDASVPQLYSYSDDIRYAINEGKQAEGRIALGYAAPADGEYTLTLKRSDMTIELHDQLTEQVVSLGQNQSYTFRSAEGEFENRFYVVLGQQTAIETLAADDAEAECYDLTGKRVASPAAGVNIIRQNGSVSKKMVR